MPEDLTYLDPELLKWALKPGTDFHLDKDNALTVKQSPPKEEKVEGASKETPAPAPTSQIPFSAYASMMAPPTGPSAAELRGLAPEQVMAVMDATGAAREAGRRTLADVEGWGLREAQKELLGAQMEKALRPTVPPLTFKQRKELKRIGPPREPKKPTVFEEKMPITAYDTVMDAVMTKDAAGNLVVSDQPDVGRMTAANKVFAKHGLEIIDVDIESIKKTGWFGWDWTAGDIPGQKIYVVTEAGQKVPRPTREQVEEALISVYGWSPEDAAKAAIAKPESKGKRKRK